MLIDNSQVTLMPKFHGFTWQDFEVSIRPKGRRGALYKLSRSHFTIPYFTGSDVNLIVTINTISGETKEFAYSWYCYHEGPDGVAENVAGDSITFLNNPQNKVVKTLRIPWVSSSGKHIIHLEVCYPIQTNNRSQKTKVADFHVIETDTFTVRLFLVLVPIVAGIIGWLLRGCVGG